MKIPRKKNKPSLGSPKKSPMKKKAKGNSEEATFSKVINGLLTSRRIPPLGFPVTKELFMNQYNDDGYIRGYCIFCHQSLNRIRRHLETCSMKNFKNNLTDRQFEIVFALCEQLGTRIIIDVNDLPVATTSGEHNIGEALIKKIESRGGIVKGKWIVPSPTPTIATTMPIVQNAAVSVTNVSTNTSPIRLLTQPNDDIVVQSPSDDDNNMDASSPENEDDMMDLEQHSGIQISDDHSLAHFGAPIYPRINMSMDLFDGNDPMSHREEVVPGLENSALDENIYDERRERESVDVVQGTPLQIQSPIQHYSESPEVVLQQVNQSQSDSDPVESELDVVHEQVNSTQNPFGSGIILRTPEGSPGHFEINVLPTHRLPSKSRNPVKLSIKMKQPAVILVQHEQLQLRRVERFASSSDDEQPSVECTRRTTRDRERRKHVKKERRTRRRRNESRSRSPELDRTGIYIVLHVDSVPREAQILSKTDRLYEGGSEVHPFYRQIPDLDMVIDGTMDQYFPEYYTERRVKGELHKGQQQLHLYRKKDYIENKLISEFYADLKAKGELKQTAYNYRLVIQKAVLICQRTRQRFTSILNADDVATAYLIFERLFQEMKMAHISISVRLYWHNALSSFVNWLKEKLNPDWTGGQRKSYLKKLTSILQDAYLIIKIDQKKLPPPKILPKTKPSYGTVMYMIGHEKVLKEVWSIIQQSLDGPITADQFNFLSGFIFCHLIYGCGQRNEVIYKSTYGQMHPLKTRLMEVTMKRSNRKYWIYTFGCPKNDRYSLKNDGGIRGFACMNQFLRDVTVPYERIRNSIENVSTDSSAKFFVRFNGDPLESPRFIMDQFLCTIGMSRYSLGCNKVRCKSATSQMISEIERTVERGCPDDTAFLSGHSRRIRIHVYDRSRLFLAASAYETLRRIEETDQRSHPEEITDVDNSILIDLSARRVNMPPNQEEMDDDELASSGSEFSDAEDFTGPFRYPIDYISQDIFNDSDEIRSQLSQEPSLRRSQRVAALVSAESTQSLSVGFDASDNCLITRENETPLSIEDDELVLSFGGCRVTDFHTDVPTFLEPSNMADERDQIQQAMENSRQTRVDEINTRKKARPVHLQNDSDDSDDYANLRLEKYAQANERRYQNRKKVFHPDEPSCSTSIIAPYSNSPKIPGSTIGQINEDRDLELALQRSLEDQQASNNPSTSVVPLFSPVIIDANSDKEGRQVDPSNEKSPSSRRIPYVHDSNVQDEVQTSQDDVNDDNELFINDDQLQWINDVINTHNESEVISYGLSENIGTALGEEELFGRIYARPIQAFPHLRILYNLVINGYGLYVSTDIPANRLVFVYNGPLGNQSDFDKMLEDSLITEEEKKHIDDYRMVYQKDQSIDSHMLLHEGSVTFGRYGNHSPHPSCQNVFSMKYKFTINGQLFRGHKFYSKKDIKAGSQLLYSYGGEYNFSGWELICPNESCSKRNLPADAPESFRLHPHLILTREFPYPSDFNSTSSITLLLSVSELLECRVDQLSIRTTDEDVNEVLSKTYESYNISHVFPPIFSNTLNLSIHEIIQGLFKTNLSIALFIMSSNRDRHINVVRIGNLDHIDFAIAWENNEKRLNYVDNNGDFSLMSRLSSHSVYRLTVEKKEQVQYHIDNYGLINIAKLLQILKE